MPAKKAAKKTTKKSAKKVAKKTVGATKKKAAKSKAKPKATSTKPKTTKPKPKPADLVDCDHCEGTGKCASSKPYDKGYHQGIFKEELLKSCTDCLIAAGKSRNSKKMVNCRFCNGSGKVEKTV